MGVQEVKIATESIWIQINFGEWKLLKDWNEDTFDNLDLAKDFCRRNFMANIGLANYEQALMNNVMWDNL